MACCLVTQHGLMHGCARSQEGIAATEGELAEAAAQLAEEQGELAAQKSALAERSERLRTEAARLEAAERAWADGEAERRRAADLLEEARAESARVKVRPVQAPPLASIQQPEPRMESRLCLVQGRIGKDGLARLSGSAL